MKNRSLSGILILLLLLLGLGLLSPDRSLSRLMTECGSYISRAFGL
jgi:hypothetical protein